MGAELNRDPDVRASVAADASGMYMEPDAVARPKTQRDVAEVLRRAVVDRMAVTTAGGQTSTTGASITDRGILLSLRALDRILDIDPVKRTARVEAGVMIADLARAAGEQDMMFAPDPTSEVEATVGGAVACNASGARTLMYGPTRVHVRALKVALVTGEVVELRRPPVLEKNTVGFAFAHDPVDWFVGSEGTLGVVLEAEFDLLPKPAQVMGLAIPFRTEEAALAFVVEARESGAVRARCLEYFDARTSAIYRSPGSTDPEATALPIVYVEQTYDGGTEPPFEPWLELAERHGADTGDIRAYLDDAALREARRQRHAIPAAMNERGSRFRPAGGRKVSTDWAVPYRKLAEAIASCRTSADAHGVPQPFVFGHAGNGHPHTNFIGSDAAAVGRYEQVVEETLRMVFGMGGTVAAEHGIGKIKRRWLPLQMTPLQISVMRAVKKQLDPHDLLAPGNVL
ncbi:MAG: FAD-binding oxidoreductase [Gemmatimonadetes bacterium]|nr:FAD-binding oxidoreductase [Gemmatimonadota bacterium]